MQSLRRGQFPRHRDPAPSRLRYRLQRLWLTRSFRKLAIYGPPVAILGVALVHFGTDPATRERAETLYQSAWASVENREEFIVDAIRVTGAGPALKDEILRAADIPIPLSSLKIDVAALRDRITTIPAVKSASVRIMKGGVIHLDVRERHAAAVWRVDGAAHVVAGDGTILNRDVVRLDHPSLPLLLGAGADKGVAEARQLMTIAGPIAGRVRGLQRIGSRRWNILLDRDQVVMLPEDRPDEALRRIVGLNAVDDLFDRDVRVVDFRDGSRPILRLGDFAVSQIRRLQAMERGEDQ